MKAGKAGQVRLGQVADFSRPRMRTNEKKERKKEKSGKSKFGMFVNIRIMDWNTFRLTYYRLIEDQ